MISVLLPTKLFLKLSMTNYKYYFKVCFLAATKSICLHIGAVGQQRHDLNSCARAKAVEVKSPHETKKRKVQSAPDLHPQPR